MKQRLSRNYQIPMILLTALPVPSALAQNGSEDVAKLPLDALEQHISEIDSELSSLSQMALRSGVGNKGWVSKTHGAPDRREWVDIDLQKEAIVDQIVIIPTIRKDSKSGIIADGFPSGFEVIAGTEGDSVGTVLASFVPEKGKILPRAAPLVIPVEPTPASWIRVDASTLTQRASDGRYVMQLSEIMAFQGSLNVALQKPVDVSSTFRTRVRDSISEEALVDGFVPYIMDSGQGEQNAPYLLFFRKSFSPSLQIDLGSSFELDRFHFHAADFSGDIPQVQHADYALPNSLMLEGAERADFSDAFTLSAYTRDSIYNSGPLIIQPFSSARCRYVRLTLLDGYHAPEARGSWRCVGLAELGLFSKGVNVAEGKIARLTGDATDIENTLEEGSITSITDGKNRYGKILPIRRWLDQLARRHDLETLRPLIAAEIQRRYARQQVTLFWLRWVSVILFAGIVISILLSLFLRKRQLDRIKLRFAADLHDEVGSNLQAITMLTDIAKEKLVAQPEVREMIGEMRAISLETTESTKHCTSVLEAKGLCENLPDELARTAKRMLADFDHEIQIEGEQFLQRLSSRRRIDLLLFYKECLANILRHTKATKVTSCLRASAGTINLLVTDNGESIPERVPASLKRRARLIGAKVAVEKSADLGTQVSLKLRC